MPQLRRQAYTKVSVNLFGYLSYLTAWAQCCKGVQHDQWYLGYRSLDGAHGGFKDTLIVGPPVHEAFWGPDHAGHACCSVKGELDTSRGAGWQMGWFSKTWPCFEVLVDEVSLRDEGEWSRGGVRPALGGQPACTMPSATNRFQGGREWSGAEQGQQERRQDCAGSGRWRRKRTRAPRTWPPAQFPLPQPRPSAGAGVNTGQLESRVSNTNPGSWLMTGMKQHPF